MVVEDWSINTAICLSKTIEVFTNFGLLAILLICILSVFILSEFILQYIIDLCEIMSRRLDAGRPKKESVGILLPAVQQHDFRNKLLLQHKTHREFQIHI